MTRKDRIERKTQSLNFWKRLSKYAERRVEKLELSKPYERCQKRSFDIGKNRIEFALYKNNLVEADPSTGLAVRLYVKFSDLDLFRFLEGRRGKIKKDLGYRIVWKEYKAWPHAIQAELSCDWVNPNDEDFEWLLRTGEQFQAVFPKYLKQYYDQGGE